jgi:hypothetical protein
VSVIRGFTVQDKHGEEFIAGLLERCRIACFKSLNILVNATHVKQFALTRIRRLEGCNFFAGCLLLWSEEIGTFVKV